MLSKNAVLLDEIINGPLLALVQPARDAGNDERKRGRESQTFANSTIVEGTPDFPHALNAFEFPHHTRGRWRETLYFPFWGGNHDPQLGNESV